MPRERFSQIINRPENSRRLGDFGVQRAYLSDVHRSLQEQRRIRIPEVAGDAETFSLENFQTSIGKDQQDRETCWAFAGCAALEAAYIRSYNVRLDLSEQYVFHVGKSTELFDYMNSNFENSGAYRPLENNSSLTGFQGSSDVAQKMKDYAVPNESLAPYQTQSTMDSIANALFGRQLPATQSEADDFEYSEKHIPLAARMEARYRVLEWFAVPANPSPSVIETIVRSGHEVVADIPGHCLLVIGYDRPRKVFIAKNSWGESDFIELNYDSDPSDRILGGHYITKVSKPTDPFDPTSQWLGRWEMDHDGWRGKLTIRRRYDRSHGSPTKLGNYFRDGKSFDVNGEFTPDGRGIQFHIADQEGRVTPGTPNGQPFEAYVFSHDPKYAAGTTSWNGTRFGVRLSRGTIAQQPESEFNKDKWLGKWDMMHDGWKGILEISTVSNDGALKVSYIGEDSAN